MAIWGLLALSVLAGLVDAWTGGELTTAAGTADTVLRYLLMVSVGAVLFATGVVHLLQPDVMADRLGWPRGSPFQRIVGVWNVGVGAIAVASFWVGGGFRAAVVLVSAVFWTGAGLQHLAQLRAGRDPDRLLTGSGELTLAAALLGCAALVWGS